MVGKAKRCGNCTISRGIHEFSIVALLFKLITVRRLELFATIHYRVRILNCVRSEPRYISTYKKLPIAISTYFLRIVLSPEVTFICSSIYIYIILTAQVPWTIRRASLSVYTVDWRNSIFVRRGGAHINNVGELYLEISCPIIQVSFFWNWTGIYLSTNFSAAQTDLHLPLLFRSATEQPHGFPPPSSVPYGYPAHYGDSSYPAEKQKPPGKL